jgi:hypothetical protein
MTHPHDALQRLREGNERFASEVRTGEGFLRRMQHAKTGCAGPRPRCRVPRRAAAPAQRRLRRSSVHTVAQA